MKLEEFIAYIRANVDRNLTRSYWTDYYNRRLIGKSRKEIEARFKN